MEVKESKMETDKSGVKIEGEVGDIGRHRKE
jgi:hypothetical protein